MISISRSANNSSSLQELFTIETLLPGNEYEKLLNIYLLIEKASSQKTETNKWDKFLYFLFHNDNYKLKQIVIEDYYKLTEPKQKQVKKQIMEINVKTAINQVTKFIRLKLDYPAFDEKILIRFYLYLLYLFHKSKTRILLSVEEQEDEYSFLDNKDYFDFEKQSDTKQQLLRKIELELEKIKAQDNSEQLLRDIYYKTHLFLTVISIKIPNKPTIPFLFSSIFMDVELFLKKDTKMRIIGFSLMTGNQLTITTKIIKLLSVLLPPPYDEEPIAEIEEGDSNYYYQLIAYNFILGVETRDELARLNMEILKQRFLNFVNLFYVKTIINKKFNKITKINEIIIKNFLGIIVSILEDDNYEESNYESSFRYISENYLKPNFYYCYVISLIINADVSRPDIKDFFEKYILSEIGEIEEKPFQLSFPLSIASSREEFQQEIDLRDSSQTTSLSESEERRFSSRSSFMKEFRTNIEDNPKELKLTFLGLIKKFYKLQTATGEKRKIIKANDNLFDNIIYPLLELN